MQKQIAAYTAFLRDPHLCRTTRASLLASLISFDLVIHASSECTRAGAGAGACAGAGDVDVHA